MPLDLGIPDEGSLFPLPLEIAQADAARLMVLFPGVPPRDAAMALLLDGLRQAEAINMAWERKQA